MRAELRQLQKTWYYFRPRHLSQVEAMALADLIVVMQGGSIEQADNPHAVFNSPANTFVAKFIGGHNVLSGLVTRANGHSVLVEGPINVNLKLIYPIYQ